MPPTDPCTYRPDPELVEAIREAEARLSEGFCPFCAGRLSPLSEYDIERTRHWWSPPTAACLSCERVVGRYPHGGVHGSTLHHLDDPSPDDVVHVGPIDVALGEAAHGE